MSQFTSDYDFYLPKELIAKYPVHPRDSAKLLIYDRAKDEITHTHFRHIFDALPSNLAYVFNDTKVIKARLFGKKQSGGKAEVLINRPLKDNLFSVFIKSKVVVTTKIYFTEYLYLKIIALEDDGSRVVAFYDQLGEKLDFNQLIKYTKQIGHIPIPPYLKREETKSDKLDYQSIFAKYDGSVAAPTASLHFTKELTEQIPKQNLYHTTLHIGAGTFKPIESDNISEHKMHFEYYEIATSTQELINSNKPLLAVGTTVARSIESYVRSGKASSETNLFLSPNNPPKRVSHLLTNFHFPKSSLIVLVSSFIGLEKTKEIYQEAICKKYRFYSYGDAMLIL